MLKNASAMIAEREALRMGIEHLTVLFPTEVSSFDCQVENSGRTVQHKLNAQSLRLFGPHAHRARANRLQNKQKTFCSEVIFVIPLRYSFQSYPHRFVGINNTSIFGLAFPITAAGLPRQFYRCFKRHCCWHRNFQLSPLFMVSLDSSSLVQ